MFRFHQLLIASAVSLLALAGCNSTQQASTPQSPAMTSSASPVAATEPAGYGPLMNVVSNTKAAVESGNFTQAQEQFSKFEDSWSKVEDGVKAKSPSSYDAIEASMDTITAGLKQSQPSKEKVLAALQSLEQTINSVAKS